MTVLICRNKDDSINLQRQGCQYSLVEKQEFKTNKEEKEKNPRIDEYAYQKLFMRI